MVLWRCLHAMETLLSGTVGAVYMRWRPCCLLLLALSTCDGELAVCYCWRCLHVMESLLSVTVGAVYM